MNTVEKDFEELRIDEALGRIALFVNNGMKSLAKNMLDSLYMKWLVSEVTLTEEQAKYMFFLVRKIGK